MSRDELVQRIDLATTPLSVAIAAASEVLNRGGLVVYPTETVYGLGACATHAGGVSTLLEVKQRPVGKAISVLVPKTAVWHYLQPVQATKQAVERYLPGPVTVVGMAVPACVDERLFDERGTLGVRVSEHPIAAALAEAGPVTATSANPAGGARPRSPEHLLAAFSDHARGRIDLVLDAGELPAREPSMVLDTTQPIQQILRAGGEAFQGSETLLISEEDTLQAGEAFVAQHADALKAGAVFLLVDGELGAGKTRLAHGVARGLGVDRPVRSPTFTLMQEYPTPAGRFLHLDLWRAGAITAQELGLDTCAQPGTLVLIEWPGSLWEASLPGLVRRAKLEVLPDDRRRLSFVS